MEFLPKAIRDANYVNVFKWQLKTYLFRIAFNCHSPLCDSYLLYILLFLCLPLLYFYISHIWLRACVPVLAICCLFCLFFIWLLGFMAQFLFILLCLHFIVKHFELHPLYELCYINKVLLLLLLLFLFLNTCKTKDISSSLSCTLFSSN